MENDKIFIRWVKYYSTTPLVEAEFLEEDWYVYTSDDVLSYVDNANMKHVTTYLFNKYWFEFVKYMKKLLNSNK